MPDLTTWSDARLLRALQRDRYRRDPCALAVEVFPHHFPRPFAPMHHHILDMVIRKEASDGRATAPNDVHLLRREGDNPTGESDVPVLRVPRLREGLKVAIAAPRNFAKSTLCSFLLPIWSLCGGEKYFMVIISNTHAQAVKFVQAIKHEWETNETLKHLYPDLRPNPDKWSEQELEFFTGAGRAKLLALGAEAQLRGVKFLQHRPDLIVLDDVEDDEMVRSEARRQNLQWWLDHVVLMTNPHATVILIGTVLHEASLLHRLVTKTQPKDRQLYGDWTTRRFRALEGGISSWSAFLTTEQLEAERDRDPYGFAQERQNDPVPPDFCPFKPDFFRETRWWTALPDRLKISITLDPACTDKEYSDETALCVAGWDELGQLWVLDMIHGKYTNPSDIIDLLFQAYMRWGVQNATVHPHHEFYCVGIEKIAFQKFLIHLFQQACRARQRHPVVKELKGDRDKTRRIWQLEPLFRDNRIFLRPDMSALQAQLAIFPNGQHDDLADALAYHLQLGLTIPSTPRPVTLDAGLSFKDYVTLSESERAMRLRYPELPRIADVAILKSLLGWN